MSPVNNFSSAASGSNIADTASVSDVVVMGKKMNPQAAGNIAAAINSYVRDGVARPVNALTANVIAKPPGGLEPKGNETTEYIYKGADMFGVENPAAK